MRSKQNAIYSFIIFAVMVAIGYFVNLGIQNTIPYFFDEPHISLMVGHTIWYAGCSLFLMFIFAEIPVRNLTKALLFITAAEVISHLIGLLAFCAGNLFILDVYSTSKAVFFGMMLLAFTGWFGNEYLRRNHCKRWRFSSLHDNHYSNHQNKITPGR